LSAKGKIFVISGPSGSGKTTLAAMLMQATALKGKLCRSISLTTRRRRSGERDKRDYFFISEAEFLRRRKAKKILEWTRYLGYYYGTDKGFVEDRLRRFEGIVLCLDVIGALRLKRMYGSRAVIIFVLPPSMKELYRRIRARSRSTTEDEIRRRLAAAREEIKAARRYDHRLINKDLNKAVARLTKIVRIYLPNTDTD
jgi:guanylate kinase